MTSFLAGLTAALLFLPLPKAEDGPEVKVIKVPIVAATKAPPRALRYPLMPEPLDQINGNAAIYWSRAGKAVVTRLGTLKSDQQELWLNGLSLNDLPKPAIHKFLEESKSALRLADQAAPATAVTGTKDRSRCRIFILSSIHSCLMSSKRER